MTTKQIPAARPTIRIERRYEARVEDLWSLWTTKEGFESWWGPEGFRVEVRKLDLRVGGDLIYDMIAVAPEQLAFLKNANMPASHATRATFVEVSPHESLGISHMIDFIPGTRPYTNDMRVEFNSQGKSVLMVICIEEHPDPQWTRNATLGMESQLTKVPAALKLRSART